MDRAKSPLSNHRELLLTISGTVVAMALAISFFVFLQNFKIDPIPASIRISANFPLYWASYIPPGFKPNAQGYTETSGKTVQVILENNSSQDITINQLAAPRGYNPLAAYNQMVSPVTTSPFGIIYNLSLKNSYRYVVNHDGTMIFITTTNVAMTQATAKQIIEGLRAAR